MVLVGDVDRGAECEADLAPCPFCTGPHCNHQVLWHSQESCDWLGPLADAVHALDKVLEQALLRRELAPPREASDALIYLIESAREYFDGSDPDSLNHRALRQYWMDVADAVGAETYRVEWSGDAPGYGDTFFHVYFERPDRGIRAVLAAAERDLALLARPTQKARAAKKRRH